MRERVAYWVRVGRKWKLMKVWRLQPEKPLLVHITNMPRPWSISLNNFRVGGFVEEAGDSWGPSEDLREVYDGPPPPKKAKRRKPSH